MVQAQRDYTAGWRFISLPIPPGTSSHSTARSRQATRVRARLRSRCRLTKVATYLSRKTAPDGSREMKELEQFLLDRAMAGASARSCLTGPRGPRLVTPPGHVWRDTSHSCPLISIIQVIGDHLRLRAT